MQVPVAHVTERANLQIVFLRHGVHEADHFGQFAARHGGVFKNRCGRNTGQRRKRRPPGARQFRGFSIILRHAEFEAPFITADFFHLRGLLGDSGGMAVGFHQQQRFAIQRQTDLRVGFNAMNRHAVEELQRAGNDLRGDDG